MIAFICFVLAVLTSPFKSKSGLKAENAVLRHQLIVLRRPPEDERNQHLQVALLRLLPAGAVAGWGLHPLESAAFARRTP